MSSESDASSKADQTRTQEALSSFKLKWETRKLPLEVILLGLAIAYAVAFSLGAILIFLYFFHYDFNPGGISASDTVLMSLTFFAVALLMAFFLALGTFAVYPSCVSVDWVWEKIRDIRMRRVPRSGDGGIDTATLSKMIGHQVQLDWKHGFGVGYSHSLSGTSNDVPTNSVRIGGRLFYQRGIFGAYFTGVL